MLPFVSPVAASISDIEVPTNPFLLNKGAVFSMINVFVFSALLNVIMFTGVKIYRLVYYSSFLFHKVLLTVGDFLLTSPFSKRCLLSLESWFVVLQCFS